MSDRATARLAYALAALALAVDVVGVALLVLTRHVGSSDTTSSVPNDAVGALTVVPFVVIGTLVATRRSRNPTGWVFLAMGLFAALGLVFERWAIYALLVNPGAGPAGTAAASLQASAYLVALTMLLFLFLLFPNGSFPAPRWKPLALLGLVAFVSAYAVVTMKPGPLGNPFHTYQNPLGVEALSGFDGVLDGVLVTTGGIILLAAALSAVIRFKRAHGVEREQFKWFALAVAMIAVGVIAHSIADGVAPGAIDAIEVVVAIAVAGLPIAAGIAILRYRLYEIDRVISRTLVYGLLTALLAGVYFGIVIGLQQVFSGLTRGNDLAIAGSTLAVAALFRPARRRIQEFVDRRFYRRRYDAQKTLEAFSTRLRDEIDLETLAAEIRSVVQETMQPSHISLWTASSAVTISGRSPGTKEIR